MKLEVDQKLVGEMPIDLIDNMIHRIDEEDWYADDYRKTADAMDHTNSIPLLHSHLCFVDPTLNAIKTISKRKLYDKYEDVLLPIIEVVRNYIDFKFYAAFIARMAPRSNIGLHRDWGAFLRTCHRVHVPLQTNENVEYIIEGASYYWKKGFVYEFDNTRRHMVKNNSDQIRIHLVLNLYNYDEEYFETIEKLQKQNEYGK